MSFINYCIWVKIFNRYSHTIRNLDGGLAPNPFVHMAFSYELRYNYVNVYTHEVSGVKVLNRKKEEKDVQVLKTLIKAALSCSKVILCNEIMFII